MSEEVKNFVISYFKEKELPNFSTEEELLKYEYLDKGVIDSVGIVELVVAIEEKFNIEFTEKDMQSPEFTTIGGVIIIIERLLEKEKSE